MAWRYQEAMRPKIESQLSSSAAEAIFAGIPVNVTLLFSREHYIAAVDAYARGIDRRVGNDERNRRQPR